MHARSGAGTFACAREESTGSGSELPRAHLFANLFDGMYFVVFFYDFSSIYFHPFSWRYIILSNLKQRGQTEILKSFIILDVWRISFASFTCWEFLRKQNQWVNLLWPQLCTQSLCVGHGVVECS